MPLDRTWSIWACCAWLSAVLGFHHRSVVGLAVLRCLAFCNAWRTARLSGGDLTGFAVRCWLCCRRCCFQHMFVHNTNSGWREIESVVAAGSTARCLHNRPEVEVSVVAGTREMRCVPAIFWNRASNLQKQVCLGHKKETTSQRTHHIVRDPTLQLGLSSYILLHTPYLQEESPAIVRSTIVAPQSCMILCDMREVCRP